MHLDLFYTKRDYLMKDFLFRFLITKFFGQNESLFYLSKKIEIIIELHYESIDFFLKYPILKLIKNKTFISISKLPDLIIQKEINSDIQIVCNYLKNFENKKLSAKDIIIEGISFSENDINSCFDNDCVQHSFIRAESLSSEECYKLLMKFIGIEKPSYYQINFFIKMLSSQLRNFSINYQCSAANLNLIQYDNRIEDLKNKNLKDLRLCLVSNFIKNTIGFNLYSFERILNYQWNNNYEGDENKEEIFSKLLSLSPNISIENINQALIFFYEGDGQEYRIISNDNIRNHEDFDNLLLLHKLPMIVQNKYNFDYGIRRREEIPKNLK